jgi:hypothetical protein
MFVEKAKKYVLVTASNPWTTALGDLLERYCPLGEGWGMNARVVDKATATEFLARGMMYLQCADDPVAINLRFRHKEAYFVPVELPEKLRRDDRVLLVKRRASDEVVPAGYDNRYHFFLINAEETADLEHYFHSVDADQNVLDPLIAKARPQSRDHSAKKVAVLPSISTGRQAPKHRVQKGMKRSVHRWHF